MSLIRLKGTDPLDVPTPIPGTFVLFMDESGAFKSKDSDGVVADYVVSTENIQAVSVDPTANDDSGDGYIVGSLWLNTTTSAVFICLDNTSTVAVWKKISPDLVSIVVACGNEFSNITVSTGKATFRMPHAFLLTEVRASVNVAPSGSTIIVDINNGGSSILSTKITIDSGEKTSTTAATPAVISAPNIDDDDEISIDLDQVGSTDPGVGLKVTLLGYRV